MLGRRYRALDLTDITGSFCGKVLAQFGVDVVKVEPPSGSSERRLGPFARDEARRDNGLYWLAYNCDKRGITLDLSMADGRALLRRLVASADFLIESFRPGYLDSLGLGYEQLATLNPCLIYISITPFGKDGPYAKFASDDLVLLALSSVLGVQGEPDRAPIRFLVEQSFPQAGAQGAAGAMIALQYRSKTGRGQHVEVSTQEALAPATYLQFQFWFHQQVLQSREGSRSWRRNTVFRLLFQCKDGYVSWRLFVAGQGNKTRALTEWMREEGFEDEVVDVDWESIDAYRLGQPEVERWEDAFQRFFLNYTRAELHRQAIKRGIMLFPMNTPRDLLADEQLAARDFWLDLPHPALDQDVRFPGVPFQSSAVAPPAHCAAPDLGQDNGEVLGGELGLSRQQLLTLKQAGVI